MPRFALFLLVPLLSACAMLGGDDDTAQAEAAAPQRLAVPVQEVGGIEVGRTRDGILVTAYGLAPGLGYSEAELRPRRDGRLGTDGFLDFELVARPPDPGFALPQGQPQARAVRADRVLRLRDVQGAVGLRVHDAQGGRQVLF